MKKTLSLVLSMIFVLMLMTSASAETYSATEKGFGGDVTVALNIENDTLVGADIQAPNETAGIGSVAVEKLAAAMVERNSVELDAVAGATITSNAVLKAAAQAVAESGASLKAVEVIEEPVVDREPEYTDVLVIGGGAGGIAAAVAAKEAGAEVILVEKLAMLGGNAAMSGGVFTRAAMEGDNEGDMGAEEFYAYLMETAENKADPAIVRNFVDKSVDTFTWLYDNMIGSYDQNYRFPMVPQSLVAVTIPGTGAQLMKHMSEYVAKVNVDIRLETPAVELIQEEGKVVGALVRHANGAEQKIYAKGGVILATGGFPSNPDMLAKYSTAGADKIPSYASAGTVGDGLVMAEKIGAQIRFSEEWDNCGAPFGPSVYSENVMYNSVIINNNGDRFANEFNSLPKLFTAFRRQYAQGATGFWGIIDDNMSVDTELLCQNGEAFKVNSLEEIAEKLNVPLENLQKTVEAYNQHAGTDNDELGKPAAYNLGLKSPYTVFLLTATRTNTIGGLVIDTEARVIDVQGNPMPGLYATGEVANSNFYYQIYTCGTAIGHAIVYGRVAGTNAAAAVK